MVPYLDLSPWPNIVDGPLETPTTDQASPEDRMLAASGTCHCSIGAMDAGSMRRPGFGAWLEGAVTLGSNLPGPRRNNRGCKWHTPNMPTFPESCAQDQGLKVRQSNLLYNPRKYLQLVSLVSYIIVEVDTNSDLLYHRLQLPSRRRRDADNHLLRVPLRFELIGTLIAFQHGNAGPRGTAFPCPCANRGSSPTYTDQSTHVYGGTPQRWCWYVLIKSSLEIQFFSESLCGLTRLQLGMRAQVRVLTQLLSSPSTDLKSGQWGCG